MTTQNQSKSRFAFCRYAHTNRFHNLLDLHSLQKMIPLTERDKSENVIKKFAFEEVS